jgi:hypothetical protein
VVARSTNIALEPTNVCVNYRTIVKDQPSDRVITEPYRPEDARQYVPEALEERLLFHWSAGRSPTLAVCRRVARLEALWGSEAVLDQRPIAAMTQLHEVDTALGLRRLQPWPWAVSLEAFRSKELSHRFANWDAHARRQATLAPMSEVSVLVDSVGIMNE